MAFFNYIPTLVSASAFGFSNMFAYLVFIMAPNSEEIDFKKCQAFQIMMCFIGAIAS
jgi:hypothetical protein